MISLDTNIWVRILTRDDSVQSSLALERIAAEPIFLPKTVLLELERSCGTAIGCRAK